MRILVAYHIPSSERRTVPWDDGFIAAFRGLEGKWDVSWHNVRVDDPERIGPIGRYDVVLAKSNWGWIVDRFVRDVFAGSDVRRAIAISGSARPPSRRGMQFYDVLFYETEWYRPQIESHPLIVHAFGVNTDIMNRSVLRTTKRFDWLTVGSFRRPKRQWLLLDKPGSKAAVGDPHRADPWVLNQLRAGGVTILDYMSHTSLADLYGSVGTVYIPAETHGGGERAVLEARACGAAVEVAPDNLKLASLLAGHTVPSHRDYADRLVFGLEAALATPPRDRTTKFRETVLNAVPDPGELRRHLARLRDVVTPGRARHEGVASRVEE